MLKTNTAEAVQPLSATSAEDESFSWIGSGTLQERNQDENGRTSPQSIEANQPLLSIAVPTWNRSALLATLLEVLLPQLRDNPEIELLVCDNASTDDTARVVERHAARNVYYHCQPKNLGSDANFISAFYLARGKYFWLCGDDDLPVPNTVEDLLKHLRAAEYDLIYATSYGYRHDWKAERHGDPLGRLSHTIADPKRFASVVNIMFTFISGMIVNKNRLIALQEQDSAIENPSAFAGTHLTQLSWTLPLLRHHRQSLVLWQRPVACRLGHNGGYELASIFGEGLLAVTARCLPDRPDLAAAITNPAIRRWFPSIIYDIRASGNESFSLDKAHAVLKCAFGGNFRYWLFSYPVLTLPIPVARIWLKGGEAISKVIAMLSIPGLWRKQF